MTDKTSSSRSQPPPRPARPGRQHTTAPGPYAYELRQLIELLASLDTDTDPKSTPTRSTKAPTP